MLPCILDKTFTFLSHLDRFAENSDEQPFSLIELASDLMFDIISSVSMGVDFGAQDMQQTSEFVSVYKELVRSYARAAPMRRPWWFTPLTEWKRQRLSKRMRSMLTPIVRKAHGKRQEDRKSKTASRSILSLSLQDVEELTPESLGEVCDQLCSFTFAGHDSTAIMISWLFFELSRTPRVCSAVCDELDALFGPGKQLPAVHERSKTDAYTYTSQTPLPRPCGTNFFPTTDRIS